MPLDFPDKELIQRAKAGDKDAYTELFNKYSDKVLGYLYRYVGDYQKAEDITIETFLDVYKRLPAYKEEGKFLSWVYKIATNFAKKEFRRSKKMKTVSLERPVAEDERTSMGDFLGDEKFRPDHEVIGEEFTRLVEETISKLDEKYKNVLLLCDVQGMSYEEASRVLKCTKVNVGIRLKRARKMFYDVLRDLGYEL